ncbi:MAG: lysylphosphatidylglycerol synthase transmembrane domain-containing protein [Blastocatellia bacterium]|nr:lysylphosphatidylglycerol synthase transmembrane domain-containing protein [Blastocatellia bacterium]
MSKKFKSLLILAVGIGLAVWFVRRLDWDVVLVHLGRARIWPLILAAGLINLTMLSRSLRWQVLLEPIARVGLRNLFAATSIGFGGIFVFGRTFEIARPFALSLRERLRPSATLATILIERVFDTSAVVLLFSVNLLFFHPSGNALSGQNLGTIRLLGGLFLAGICLAIATLVLLRLKSAPLLAWLARATAARPRGLVTPALNLAGHLSEGLSVLLNGRALRRCLFHTACVWGLVTTATWLTLFAFQLDLSVSHAIFVLGFGLIGSIVPTPGGSAGAFHGATSKGLEFLGMETNLAASIAIIYHLVAFGSPFLFGLYFLVRDGLSFGQLREMIASENQTGTPESGA